MVGFHLDEWLQMREQCLGMRRVETVCDCSQGAVDLAVQACEPRGGVDFAWPGGVLGVGGAVRPAAVGVPPQIMGIGPAPAIRAVLEVAGMTLDQIGRVEINEAFGAQVLACVDELGLDEAILNVNGGAIAIGHPLGVTGIRLGLTLANELKRSGTRYGVASACIGGGQGIALLLENPEAV